MMAGTPVSRAGGTDGEAGPARLPAAAGALIVVGASTGGTEALKLLISGLPAGLPALAIVQHMPEMYTASFAERLDAAGALRVSEARHGEPMLAGHAYVAPGHSHLGVRRVGAGFVTELSRGEPVNRHRPSVDVLFESAAGCGAATLIGVLLTGMGRDGAAGMLALKRAGAWNIAQDEASSVVFGMPRAAAELGAAHEVAPIHDIARRIVMRLGRAASARA